MNYLKYLITNLKNKKYNIGILMILTIIMFSIIISQGYVLSGIIELIIGTAICISYSNYQYDMNNKLK